VEDALKPAEGMRFLPADAYQPLAATVFESVAATIARVLPDATVEHIGASSVPGLTSKGDLDIFVGVDAARFDAAVLALEALGLRVKEGSLRTGELCPFEAFGHPLDVGVQLVARGSEFEFFRTFRDKLRRDARLCAEYDRLKASCRGLEPDRYRAVKSAFIERVLGGGARDEST
jgi:GrpB-like predicted nucleotidyltransferase (UPF0157 family)